MGYGIEAYNERGEKILGSDLWLSGIMQRFTIGTISRMYDRSVMTPPSFIDRDVGVVGANVNLAKYSSTFFQWKDNACLCGRSWYSADSGTLIYCNKDYAPESGIADVYNSDGKLTWSAKSAVMIPMIADTIEIYADDLLAGVTIQGVKGNALLMNNLPSILLPAPRGNVAVGGLYIRFNGNTLQVQYFIKETSQIASNIRDQLGGQPLRLLIARIGNL